MALYCDFAFENWIEDNTIKIGDQYWFKIPEINIEIDKNS